MRLLLFSSLFILVSSFASEPPNLFLGTQAIGGRYHFTKEEPLLESAKLLAELGSGIMKFAISKQASFGRTKANVRGSNPGLQTLAEIAAKEPTHRAVLDMPFTHFFLWAYPFTTHGSAGTFKTAERDLEYREMFDLTTHLLRTYSGSGRNPCITVPRNAACWPCSESRNT